MHNKEGDNAQKWYTTPCPAVGGLSFWSCPDDCRPFGAHGTLLQNLSTFAESSVHSAEERGERVWAPPENFRGCPPRPFGYNGTIHAYGVVYLPAGSRNVLIPIPRFCFVRR